MSADGSILPASSHEEVEKLLRYLDDDRITLVHIEGEWSMPVFGSHAVRNKFENVNLLRSQLSAHLFDR